MASRFSLFPEKSISVGEISRLKKNHAVRLMEFTGCLFDEGYIGRGLGVYSGQMR